MIEIVQTCDRCEKKRIIEHQRDAMDGGWRELTSGNTTKSLWLDPECLVIVQEFIMKGVL